MEVRNSTWIIADTHFGHKNIVKFQQRPESHDVIMLDQWIKRVGEDDYILHLGDVFLGKQGNPERWARVISRLPGRKYLIKGNHDRQKPWVYELAGFKVVDPFIHRGVAFSHRPITPQFPLHAPDGPLQGAARAAILKGATFPVAWDGWHTNVHGHIHGNTLAESCDRHGEEGPIPGKTYINACVEMHDLSPVQLGILCPLQKGTP